MSLTKGSCSHLGHIWGRSFSKQATERTTRTPLRFNLQKVIVQLGGKPVVSSEMFSPFPRCHVWLLFPCDTRKLSFLKHCFVPSQVYFAHQGASKRFRVPKPDVPCWFDRHGMKNGMISKHHPSLGSLQGDPGFIPKTTRTSKGAPAFGSEARLFRSIYLQLSFR